MKRLTALILAILVIIAVPVMASAANSPSGTETVKIDAKPSNTAQGSVEKTVNADGSVKLVATPAKGYTFKNWTITAAATTAQAPVNDAQVATNAADTANYTIVSGSLTSATLVIKPNVDLVVVAVGGDHQDGHREQVVLGSEVLAHGYSPLVRGACVRAACGRVLCTPRKQPLLVHQRAYSPVATCAMAPGTSNSRSLATTT